MLSYTFETLNNKSYNGCGEEEYTSIIDLFASILVKGIKSQLKRGVIREYNQTEEITHNVRGRIDVTKSINANYTITKKVACTYDELTINSKPNQILKATLKLLVKKVSPKIKREINTILMTFSSVKDIKIKSINWNIHFNSSNQTYRLLITMCNLVVFGLDNNEELASTYNFFDEENMGILFKQFVVEYYRKNYKLYRMHSPKIEWNTRSKDIELLPSLNADIFVSNYEKKVMIKTYYNVNEVTELDILQIYSMVKNVDTKNNGEVSGVLLYATTEDVIEDKEYVIGLNKILIKQINLNDDIEQVKGQLESIISTIH